jgi:hypothetical protein
MLPSHSRGRACRNHGPRTLVNSKQQCTIKTFCSISSLRREIPECAFLWLGYLHGVSLLHADQIVALDLPVYPADTYSTFCKHLLLGPGLNVSSRRSGRCSSMSMIRLRYTMSKYSSQYGSIRGLGDEVPRAGRWLRRRT